MKDQYILICTQRGVFLGTGPFPGTDQLFAYFASANLLGVYLAPTWPTEEQALAYGAERLNHTYNYEYLAVAVPSKQGFATVTDIIKAGYGEHCKDMMIHLPNYHPVMQ